MGQESQRNRVNKIFESVLKCSHSVEFSSFDVCVCVFKNNEMPLAVAAFFTLFTLIKLNKMIHFDQLQVVGSS